MCILPRYTSKGVGLGLRKSILLFIGGVDLTYFQIFILSLLEYFKSKKTYIKQ